jgi:large subunit ribosomal protein L17
MPSVRKLGRKTDHRRAMMRGMVTLLLDKGRIETTLHRAKELKRVTDKMITVGKKNTLAAKRTAFAYITKEEVVKKLFDQIAPSFEDRQGGYTRVLKLGPRRGDGAEMAIIELVNYEPPKSKAEKADEKKAKKSKKADKSDKTGAEAETKADEKEAAE